jgi:hypothetical protein
MRDQLFGLELIVDALAFAEPVTTNIVTPSTRRRPNVA